MALRLTTDPRHRINRGLKPLKEMSKDELREYKRECGRRSYSKLHKGNSDYLRNRNLKWNYNITLDDYNKIHNQQNGTCAICKESDPSGRLVVDHCHKTGKVRGLLCNRCNPGIGYFREDEELLASAILYLRERKSCP